MCKYLDEFNEAKEIRCANRHAFTQEVILSTNQAFLMWFEFIRFIKTGKKLTFMAMFCTIKNNLMYNLACLKNKK
jgi:hypothetical protein